LFDVKNQEVKDLFNNQGIVKNISIDEQGNQIAFLYTKDTTTIKRYGLYYWNQTLTSPKLLADTSSISLPSEWEISENFQLYFSQDGVKLFFATAPKIKPEPKDTLLEEEKYKVDIWNWNDAILQSEQIKNLDKDKKKTYLAVFNLDNNNLFQLADTLIDEVKLNFKGNGNYAVGFSHKPYLKIQSWEDAEYKDVYLLNLITGEKIQVINKIKYSADISPSGNYLLWYHIIDSSWHSYSIQSGITNILTNSINQKFGDELNDLPQEPLPYGYGGWTENDENVFIYDRYDIWKISPSNLTTPQNLTNGRENKIISRYIKIDEDINFIKKSDKFLIKVIDENSYSEGFCYGDLINGIDSSNLIFSDNHFSEPIKSKKSDKLIWQKGSYTEFPDLWCSTTDFSGIKKISETNPQMKTYLWGTVEMINWKNIDGMEMKGLLYKPENFDSSQKYPMIVYFYEKYTSAIHTHYIPNPSRSVINFPLYNSNGYLIFIPDITYKIGYPGESALKVVVSGTQYLISRGFVDKDNVGIQGQSWGGYEVAYIVTQTDMFKAAMSGAPVSNMTSAYGGIRWESGKNRIFQYEQAQSRIGGTLWEKFDLYIKNSPLFFVDKITTPLLIMSNDNDGAVPYQEGLQFFISLRRLGKPAWLLCYNGDEHNLTKWPNRKDLSIRMKQFFDHFLKDAPSPSWMEEGIPAIEKGKKSGY
jgi:dipeptidyl aminopeptidase/acylaminoacyl peptidase